MSRNLNGWKRDKFDARDKLFRVSPNVAVPDEVTLSGHVLDILDQGHAGSCVANAVAQAIRVCTLRDGAGWTLPSRLWLYALARKKGGFPLSSDDGCYIRDAFGAAKALGYPSEETWPYSDTRVFDEPEWRHYRLAIDQRWTDGYYRVAPNAAAIKEAVASGCPVVFGTDVDQKFVDYCGGVWGLSGKSIGGHAMVIVGYNEDTAEVVNSWGSDWGSHGYVNVAWWSIEQHAADLWAVAKPEIIDESLHCYYRACRMQRGNRPAPIELHDSVPELGETRLRRG